MRGCVMIDTPGLPSQSYGTHRRHHDRREDPLLADIHDFPEGTQGTVKEVRAHDDEIWHAIVTWSYKSRNRRIRGVLKPNDLDFVEIIPRRSKYRPEQLSILFSD